MMKDLLYPIRAVSKQTGISIDTLRAWERRYQVVSPQRDERGRLFSAADVRRLKLLRAAVDQGHAIGQLAALIEGVFVRKPMQQLGHPPRKPLRLPDPREHHLRVIVE